MRKPLVRLCCAMGVNAQANVIQFITGISYNNPAELARVQQNEAILGGTAFYTDGRFNGSALNFLTGQYDSGTNHTRTTSLLPYGRIAKRINPKWVFGIDVTEPFHSNLNWGNNEFTRYACTQNYLTDVLKNNEVNWAFPTGPDSSAILTNRTGSYGTGFNLGMNFSINQNNHLAAAYYSAIDQNTRGYSTLGGPGNTNLSFDFHMPATSMFSYTHMFNPKWLVVAKAYQTEWSINQYVRYKNTAAGNFDFHMGYKKAWAYVGALHHQYNEKMGLTALGVIDNGPEREPLRTINFPSDTQYFLAAVVDYKVTTHATVELLYGHLFSTTTVQNTVSLPNGANVPFTTGHVLINADVIDLKFKMTA